MEPRGLPSLFGEFSGVERPSPKAKWMAPEDIQLRLASDHHTHNYCGTHRCANTHELITQMLIHHQEVTVPGQGETMTVILFVWLVGFGF